MNDLKSAETYSLKWSAIRRKNVPHEIDFTFILMIFLFLSSKNHDKKTKRKEQV